MEAPPFWLVWSPSGDREPRFKHADSGAAEREAERLADQHPGREFYVLQPTYHVVAQRRLTQRFSDDAVPF